MINTIIFMVITLGLSYFFIRKLYKKCESIFEKSLFIISVFLIGFITVLYYFDRFNIPSIFGWNKNVSSQNWLNLLSNFGITILAEVLGGLILIFVTLMQIENNNSNNSKRDKEERRINNLPLLEYSFLESDEKVNNKYFLPSIFEDKDGNFLKIVLKIKNIGMNAIRKCYIKLNSESLQQDYYCQIDNQSSIDKNEEKFISFLVKLPIGKYKYSITVYYEDLLHNWYSQNIDLQYYVTNYFNNNSHITKSEFDVYDEKNIEEPNIKFNLEKIL